VFYYTLATVSSKLGIKPGAKNALILIAILLTYCVTNTSVETAREHRPGCSTESA